MRDVRAFAAVGRARRAGRASVERVAETPCIAISMGSSSCFPDQG